MSERWRGPGASLFGFEGEPRTPEQRNARDRAVEALRTGLGEMVSFAPGAGCRLDAVEVEEEGDHRHGGDEQGDEEHADEEHAEVEVEARFACQGPLVGTPVQLAFGRFFPGVASVDLQVVTAQGQAGGRVSASSRFTL